MKHECGVPPSCRNRRRRSHVRPDLHSRAGATNRLLEGSGSPQGSLLGPSQSHRAFCSYREARESVVVVIATR